MTDAHANARRFASFSGLYDRWRPTCPGAAVKILSSFVPGGRPELVVDIGCGTGLSTLAWEGRAARVLGVEPCPEMLEVARGKARPGGAVSFLQAFSDNTGLPEGCADIVTCSQAFHWMDPAATIPEIARILKPGGVFAAYDCDWPVVCDWRAEREYQRLFRLVLRLEHRHPELAGAPRWPKEKHLYNLRRSGKFRFVREIVFSSTERGGGERFIGLALSQGRLQELLKTEQSETLPALERFERNVRQIFGPRRISFRFCYRMRLAVK